MDQHVGDLESEKIPFGFKRFSVAVDVGARDVVLKQLGVVVARDKKQARVKAEFKFYGDNGMIPALVIKEWKAAKVIEKEST